MSDVLATLTAGAPRPILSQSSESRLGPRHRQVLDQLEGLFLARGFAAFTVAELAAGAGCSRRTLYELAPSKDRLVLLVLDRFLHRVGRAALAAIDPSAPVLQRIRSYVTGGIEVLTLTNAFADDLADDPAARRLLDAHFRYVMTVIERLVREGVDAGELRPIDPAVVAAAIAGSSVYVTRHDVADTIGLGRERLVDAMLDFLLGSLALSPRLSGGSA